MLEVHPPPPAAPVDDDLVDAVIDTVRRWATERVDSRALDRAKRVPAALIREMAEMGLFGLTLPEDWGGSGLSLASAGRVIAALARHDRSVATTLGLHLGLGTRGLVRWGNAAQVERWGARLASGELVGAFATTEPDAGSDLTALRTTIAAAGDGLSVTGSKIFVTNGGYAHLFTVAGRSPGLGGARRGQSVVLLEKGDPGLEVGPEEDKLGLRASSTTTLVLEDVRVPMDRLLGVPATGAEMLRHILSWGRTVMAAGCCGTAAEALARARLHCASRVQFARPLDQLAVVREQLADMAAVLYAIEALVAWASADEGMLEVRSLSAKVLASEGSGEVCDTALQLHGGYGYIEETGMALLVRDGRITRIFEGANDVLRIHRGLFAAAGERFGLGPDDAVVSPSRARVGTLTALVAEEVDGARQALGLKLGGDHPTLHRLGSLAMLRDAAEAVVVRAEAEGGHGHALAARWLDIVHARVAGLRARDRSRASTDACLEWSP